MKVGSQPTYEELKPQTESAAGTERFGSQPTYEELKPGLAYPVSLVRPISSQPTYEELKRAYVSRSIVPQAAFAAYL